MVAAAVATATAVTHMAPWPSAPCGQHLKRGCDESSSCDNDWSAPIEIGRLVTCSRSLYDARVAAQEQEMLDLKQAIAWDKLAVPEDVFGGLVARGGNCFLQQLLETANGELVRCSCQMCRGTAGGNNLEPWAMPEELPRNGRDDELSKHYIDDVSAGWDECKLFAYLKLKVENRRLPPLTELPCGPYGLTLVTRLASSKAASEKDGPWLRRVRKLPYKQQLDFFHLVHDIACELGEADGEFNEWFCVGGRSLSP